MTKILDAYQGRVKQKSWRRKTVKFFDQCPPEMILERLGWSDSITMYHNRTTGLATHKILDEDRGSRNTSIAP